MKPVKLPNPVLGIDVRSPETEVPGGAVRSAQNVILTDTGAVRRAPGPVLRGALPDAHSLWQAKDGRVLCAAGETLYEVLLGDPTTFDPIFVGLPIDEPVEYDDGAGEIYFTSGEVLGKLCGDGLVRRPGVADLLGVEPVLGETVGELPAGTYGVAYSLTNDLGEESGLSSVAWLDVAEGTGILVSNLAMATDVAKVSVYVTPPDGAELYHYKTLDWVTMTSITTTDVDRLAEKTGRIPMPGGAIVRFRHGRLYVAHGSFVIFSDPHDPGLTDPRSGWANAGAEVTLMEPVEGGLYVGTADKVTFYAGAGPEDYKVAEVVRHGAVAHSGRTLPADYFDPRLVGDGGLPVAAWLSDVGLTIGAADGRILAPQGDRVILDAIGGRSVSAVKHGGVRQVIFHVESMDMGVGSVADGTV